MPRPDGRAPDALRPLSIELGLQRFAAGSVLVRLGDTHVLCAATFEEKVPPHRIGRGGWISAEYGLLPGSTSGRARRERSGVGGRTAEIQRLIGRSLRAAFDLEALEPRTLWLDCDVLQADGGTRCAAITGAYVAAAIALGQDGVQPVSALSAGVVGGEVVLDLCYAEDSSADVDLNFVACPGGIIEIQGTAERRPFTRAQLGQMMDLAERGCADLFSAQRDALSRARSLNP